jgi:3-methyladenine DNA glycosylase AlkD
MSVSSAEEVAARIDAAGEPGVADALGAYFQVKPGGYGEGDRFVGVKLSVLRGLLKPYAGLPVAEVERLLASGIHEHRLAALVLMAGRAARALRPRSADPDVLAELHEVYLRNTRFVNNWDLVDCSAPDVVGGYLLDKPRDELRELVRSDSVWERRIGLVATQRLIGAGQTADTYALAALVLEDRHDLIHKAAGWMLREAGKRVDEAELLAFLDRYAERMPRTMLRYAIERLEPAVRKGYLART